MSLKIIRTVSLLGICLITMCKAPTLNAQVVTYDLPSGVILNGSLIRVDGDGVDTQSYIIDVPYSTVPSVVEAYRTDYADKLYSIITTKPYANKIIALGDVGGSAAMLYHHEQGVVSTSGCDVSFSLDVRRMEDSLDTWELEQNIDSVDVTPIVLNLVPFEININENCQ